MQQLTAAPSTMCLYVLGAVLFTAAPNPAIFSNALELRTVVGEGKDCSFLPIATLVLQAVSMSCSEICVPHGAKTGCTCGLTPQPCFSS